MTELAHEEFERRVGLEGPANFRDVGGYQTSDGSRVRTGLVFRSDSLSRLTAADAELLGRLGVRTVIDLRTHGEVDRTPPTLLEHVPAVYEHVPIVDEGGAAARPKDFVFPELHVAYAGMLDRFGDHIARALGLVVTSPKPTVFFCEAGKDRTGLVAALLLSTLGVPDPDVAADYTLTSGALPVILGRVHDRRTFGDDAHRVPDHALTAEEATMLTTLDALRERHGSVETYLEAHGMERDSIDAVRAELLDDQPG